MIDEDQWPVPRKPPLEGEVLGPVDAKAEGEEIHRRLDRILYLPDAQLIGILGILARFGKAKLPTGGEVMYVLTGDAESRVEEKMQRHSRSFSEGVPDMEMVYGSGLGPGKSAARRIWIDELDEHASMEAFQNLLIPVVSNAADEKHKRQEFLKRKNKERQRSISSSKLRKKGRRR
jgi:hypothetical protein